MKSYKKDIKIAQSTIDIYNKMMTMKVDLADINLPKYEMINCWSADFDDGHTMDIRVNTSEDDVWCEAVLFNKGGEEVDVEDVKDTLDGIYKCEDNDVVYEVYVTNKDEEK